MSVRDKIMDKYWLEFISTAPDLTLVKWEYGVALAFDNAIFWHWFYKEKVSKNHGKLEDYL